MEENIVKDFSSYDFNMPKFETREDSIRYFAGINEITIDEANEVFAELERRCASYNKHIGVVETQYRKIARLASKALRWTSDLQIFNLLLK